MTLERGEKISFSSSGAVNAPDFPVVPFVEGDDTGRDLRAVSEKVFDAAVKRVFGTTKSFIQEPYEESER